jgi:hypothetical protein
MMIDLNKVQLPATRSEDENPDKSIWQNDKYVGIDEGSHVTYFIGHESVTTVDEEGNEHKRTLAFPIRVGKPVSRDAAINAAEMEAYGLATAMDVASFTASLARKFREDSVDTEVLNHDEFIAWVKDELTKLGL